MSGFKLNLENAVGYATDKAARGRDSHGFLLPGKDISYAGSITESAQVGLLSGFGPPEADGRWSLEGHCTLDVKLRGIDPTVGYVLVVEVLPFEMGGHRASVRVSADEAGAAATVPLGLGWVQLSLPCKINDALRPARARVDFWVDNPESPSSLGVGGDSRRLGFKLRSLRLEAAQQSPAIRMPQSDPADIATPEAGSFAVRAAPVPAATLAYRLRNWLRNDSLLMAPLRWIRRTSQSLARIERQHSLLHEALQHRVGEVRAEVAALHSQGDELRAGLSQMAAGLEALRMDFVEREDVVQSLIGRVAIDIVEIERARKLHLESLFTRIDSANRSMLAACGNDVACKIDAMRIAIASASEESLGSIRDEISKQLNVDDVEKLLKSGEQILVEQLKELIPSDAKLEAITADIASANRDLLESMRNEIARQPNVSDIQKLLELHEEKFAFEMNRLALLGSDQAGAYVRFLGTQEAAQREQTDTIERFGMQVEKRFENLLEVASGTLESIVSTGITHQIDQEVPLLISLHQKMDSLVNNHRPQLFVKGSDGWIIRTQYGYFSCALDDEMLVMYLAEYGELEPGLRKLMVSLLRAGDVFIDVGANIGLHSVVAARTVGSAGQVYAIEASPPTLVHLRKSIHLSGVDSIVTVLAKAAGAAAEPQRAMHLSNTSGHSSLFPLEDAVAEVSVDVAAVDDLVSGRVDLVKIDVEGAELDVIAGMRRVLEQNPELAVVAEFAPSHLARANVNLQDWRSMVLRHGFEVFSIDDVDGHCTHVVDLEVLMSVYSVNLLLVRPGARIWEQVSHG